MSSDNLKDRLCDIEEKISALKEELALLQEDREELILTLEDAVAIKVASHIDALTDIVEDHNYTSCSDNDPRNWRGSRCARCCLLGVKSGRLRGVRVKVEAIVPGES